jgi:hypothetical protein
MAAGTRTTDSDGAKLPIHPCVAAKARNHDAHAIVHRRAAQTRRIPLPSSSGRAEPATNAQAIGESTAGPMANRVSSPQLGAAAPEIGSPKIATECPPASRTPTTQGAQSSAATPRAFAVSAARRPARTAWPVQREPRANATAQTIVMGNTAGANEPAAAMMAPSATGWPDRPARQPWPTT